MKHNCKIKRFYFKYSGYMSNIDGSIKKLSSDELYKNRKYIEWLSKNRDKEEFRI